MKKVQDIMSKTVHACTMDTTLEKATMIMWNNDCGCVPIVDEQEKPIGMVTDRDIAMGSALQHKPQWELQLRDITNGHSLFSCRTTDDVERALQTMKDHAVRRLPVVDDMGKLAGVVSIGDILASADAKANTEWPVQTLGMLQAVTGHHMEQRPQA
ncbi:CBS domain-containing protein [Aestuariicella hydrocarbonica]|uniref:CBS domain-containing protein n=1 Tax=Pseudomaricurvus hydrocarbonicus TaxID=1470433 RepID=A0A9E5MLQ4_9GAMM|nr:CBS domain-containing protein [Aestuariicella hydrocarbonica]NHO65183.1 CBS domain-containing protein [Aestuariicella hydrocarbonica]